MTTQPEAAMTREQVLYKAWTALCFLASHGGDAADALYARGIADEIETALASTRQEPAPAADAEEVREAIARQIYMGVWNDVIPRTAELSFERDPDPYFQIADNITAAVPALRRYAGDGGVTDEQVEAAWKEFNCSWLDKAHVRAALEAAARAKSGEKGRAR